MDIVTRLKMFIDYLGMANSTFADQANITRPTLSQILNGRNKKISNELISKLHEAFPSLNIMWLMFGDGDMIVGDDPNGGHSYTPHANTNATEPRAESPEDGRGFDINLFDLDDRPSQRVKSNVSDTDTNTENGSRQEVVDTRHRKNPDTRTTEKENKVNNLASFWSDIAPENHRRVEAPATEGNKTVSYIMVFYSDNSYEMFRPQREDQPGR